MNPKFFEQPILNSPYEAPARHWELDANGQPTHRLIETRRQVRFESPIPAPKKRGGGTQLGTGLGPGRSRRGQVRPGAGDPGPARGSHTLAPAPQPPTVAGDAGDCSPAGPLAPGGRVEGHPALLLSGGGGGDGDLVDRSGPQAARSEDSPVPQAPGGGQRSAWRVAATGPQAGHRRRQDDGPWRC